MTLALYLTKMNFDSSHFIKTEGDRKRRMIYRKSMTYTLFDWHSIMKLSD